MSNHFRVSFPYFIHSCGAISTSTDSLPSALPAVRHCRRHVSPWTSSNIFFQLISRSRTKSITVLYLVSYSLSLCKRVKSAKRGVLSRSESTEISFVVRWRRLYDATLDPLADRGGVEIRVAVDMKFHIHIHIHIHRFSVDIHGYPYPWISMDIISTDISAI